MIVVQERYPAVVHEIKAGPTWQEIDAAKNGRVVLMPEYTA